MTTSANLFLGLRCLYGKLPSRRRRQLYTVVALMLAGAGAEIVTIGAVVPFLSLLTGPSQDVVAQPLFSIFNVLGWREREQYLLASSILFATIALAAAGIRLLLLWKSQNFAYCVGRDLAIELYKRTLYQPYSYHISTNTSELIGGVNKVQLLLVMIHSILNIAVGAIISCAILLALLAINATVALGAATTFGFIYFFIAYITRLTLTRNSQTIAKAQVDRVKAAQEALGGIRDVIIDGTQSLHLKKFAEIETAFRGAQARNGIIGGAPRFILEAFGMVFIATLAVLLSQSKGGLSAALPVLGALALGAQRLLPLIQQVYFGWSQLAGNRQILFDMLATLELPIEQKDRGKQSAVPLSYNSEIRLQGVHFQYSGSSRPVLTNINLEIHKGTCLALVGKTGSGKSTLIDLIIGLISPTSGVISIDGKSLTSEDILAWQERIAHVPQSIYLTDASIGENIAFGAAPKDIDWGRVSDAAQAAKIADFIERLPSGYNTVVGERGVRLSGGQRQRIGIARALYKNADLLILDEATSALDHSTEQAVMDVICTLSRQKTIIMIAHKLSAVARCDRIIVLEDGRVSGCGSYEEIAHENASFRELASNGPVQSRST